MPWMPESVPESVGKLAYADQELWAEVANSALDEGYDEGAAIAIAWSVVNKTRGAGGWEPAVYMKYPLLRPGSYDLAKGGDLDIQPETVAAVHRAIARLYELGQPVSIIYGHGSTESMGLIPASQIEDDVLYGCLLYDQRFRSGVMTGEYGFSIEGYRDYSSSTYTAGETYPLWPVAWALLGADEQPACPPGQPLAADENKPAPVVWFTGMETAPVRGAEPQRKEAVEMDELKKELEELRLKMEEQADRISTFEAAEKELQEQLRAAEQERDELREAEQKRLEEVKAAEVQNRIEKILAAEGRPGVREKIEAKLTEAETVEAKEQLLDAWEAVVEPGKLPEQKLQAAESKPDEGKEVDPYDAHIEAAEKLAAEERIPFNVALERVTMKEAN